MVGVLRAYMWLLAVVAGLIMSASPAFAQLNQIYNPGFEMGPSRSNSNLMVPSNTGNAVGWLDAGGQPLNIVQVDGPGGFNYGTFGPENDASGTATASAPRRYLDINGGSNTVYQRFVPKCTGDVTFGAWFSTRDNLPGTGSIRIIQGTNIADTQAPVVSNSNTVNLPAGHSKTDPWVLSSGSVNLVAGTAYMFAISMNDNLNMDSAYLQFSECSEYPDLPDVSVPEWPPITPVPHTDPCCPPWDDVRLGNSLFYRGVGSIGANYTLEFEPSTYIPALQAYLNYVDVVNPAISAMVLQVNLHDQGTNQWPASHANAVGSSYYNPGNGTAIGPVSGIIFTPGATTVAKHVGYAATPAIFMGATSPSASPLNYAMQTGRWYAVRSAMWLEGGTFFEDKCAREVFYVRVQAMGKQAGRDSLVLEVLGPGARQAKSKPLSAGRKN